MDRPATIHDYPHTFMTVAEADEMARILNSDPDDEWTYHAMHDPKGTGWSFVEIRDEDGETVGRL